MRVSLSRTLALRSPSKVRNSITRESIGIGYLRWNRSRSSAAHADSRRKWIP
jgi:hypothetical protein